MYRWVGSISRCMSTFLNQPHVDALAMPLPGESARQDMHISTHNQHLPTPRTTHPTQPCFSTLAQPELFVLVVLCVLFVLYVMCVLFCAVGAEWCDRLVPGCSECYEEHVHPAAGVPHTKPGDHVTVLRCTACAAPLYKFNANSESCGESLTNIVVASHSPPTS